MPSYCIMCKKESTPYDNRSYHKFPTDPAMKQKWMEVLGRTKVSKNATICSNHFDAQCFHENHGYTHVRRLLKTAVPSVSSGELSGNDGSQLGLSASDSRSPSDTNDLEPDEAPILSVIVIKREPASDSNEVQSPDDEVGDVTPSVAIDVTEKGDAEDDACSAAGCRYTWGRRFWYRAGSRRLRMSRKDFATSDSWRKFLFYHESIKRRIRALRRENLRRRNEIS